MLFNQIETLGQLCPSICNFFETAEEKTRGLGDEADIDNMSTRVQYVHI